MSRFSNITWLIDKELDNYKVVMDSLGEHSPDYQKYQYFCECLDTFKEKLLLSDFDFPSIIFSVLQANYGKYDTRLIFSNGNTMVIGKDEVWTFDDHKYIFMSDDDNPHRMSVGYNCDYVERFETITDEDTVSVTVENED